MTNGRYELFEKQAMLKLEQSTNADIQIVHALVIFHHSGRSTLSGCERKKWDVSEKYV